MTGFADMALGDLDALLSKLQADLEDVEEQKLFVLGQTGVHISAAVATKYEIEIDDLRSRIERVENAIRDKRPEQP
jgi:hypothetical protein